MTTKYNKSEIFKAAWSIVKTSAKTLSEALKSAWASVKNVKLYSCTAVAVVAEKIINGGSFNGTVYTKFNGKNWASVFVYVSGKIHSLGQCEIKKAQQVKAAFESELSTLKSVTNHTSKTNEWLVNEKKVVNKLSYGEMWNRYGTDFE